MILSNWVKKYLGINLTLGGGKAPVTRVTKEIFSHFNISQQFFKALTEPSLVLNADVALA